MDRQHGMTLLEVVVVMAILTIVAGILFVLAQSLGIAVGNQEARATIIDEARRGMQFVVRELRQSARSTIPWHGLPSNTLTYQIAVDADGNGVAVDINNNLELSAVRTIGPDLGDVNGDGLTWQQLIMTDGVNTRVIANDLTPNEDANSDGILAAGEDLNANNTLDHGVWFEQSGNGLAITIQTQRRGGAQGTMMSTSMTEIVVPRN